MNNESTVFSIFIYYDSKAYHIIAKI